MKDVCPVHVSEVCLHSTPSPGRRFNEVLLTGAFQHQYLDARLLLPELLPTFLHLSCFTISNVNFTGFSF